MAGVIQQFLCIATLLIAVELCAVDAFRKKNKKSSRNEMATEQKTIAGVPVHSYHLVDLARSHLRGRGSSLVEDAQNQSVSEVATDWIVMLKPGSTDAQIHSVCEEEGVHCLFEGHADGVAFVDVEATEIELQELLAKHPGEVDFVEPDLPTEVIPDYPEENGDATDVGIQARTWGLNRIKSSTRRRAGTGTNVYIVDTGIRYSHSEFGGRAKPGFDATTGRPHSCGNSKSCAYDRHGHGTHCAGTAAGNSVGVAPGATIYAVKVLGDDGRGQGSWLVAGYDWVARSGRKPAVASMSLGGPGQNQASRTAVDRMVNAGITVVVAAGNDGADACRYAPAFVPSAITVGSTDRNDRRSQFGRGSSNFGRCVNIFAPGSDVLSASHRSNSGTAKMSGTSMACPHVAGVCSLILGANKGWKPSQVKSALLKAALRNKVTDPKGSANYLLQMTSGR